ncbi:MAG: oxaloacetate decarboxylase [Candidatus Lambdaproteobacteria bacterium]|nr:oxaloacetate decarboxylase [Candidatus Lambdaproteobacteria bacterium]
MNTATAAGRLRALLGREAPIVAPGVFDGLSARLVARAGFAAVYASGGAIARSMSLPDLGLLSMSDMLARLSSIVDAVDIPVIADADTGYGNALNVQRAVRAFCRAGVAALHLEDQDFPKRCGHYDDKALISAGEMAGKLRAARDAAGAELVLIARTDALAVEGLDAAVERAAAYVAAGADVIFVEAPTSEEQIAQIARRVPHPKLINMFQGGKTPLVPLARLAALGYRIVIVPSDLQRASIGAMQAVLGDIARDGNSATYAGPMPTFAERETIVGTADFLRLDKRYGSD